MKIIMLDIDGVLNWAGTEEKFAGFVGIDPTRVARFNKIIEAVPDVKIVVSSTWRLGFAGFYERGLEGISKVLKDHGVKGDIIDITPETLESNRGKEIALWLDSTPGVTHLAILDDDISGMYLEVLINDQLKKLKDFHVQTYWMGDAFYEQEEGGLLDRHITEAIKLLGK